MTPRPLVVRLCNWIGDVVLSLPALQQLQSAGYALQLYGKGWAPTLLSGYGWPVTVRARTLGERVAQLKALRQLNDASAAGRVVIRARLHIRHAIAAGGIARIEVRTDDHPFIGQRRALFAAHNVRQSNRRRRRHAGGDIAQFKIKVRRRQL